MQVQQFYKQPLTFALADPVVTVIQSTKPADYYYSHPNGPHVDDYGFNNTYDELKTLLPGKFGRNSHDDVFVVYCDSPGNKGRACISVAILPENDLIGLIGRHPTEKNISRWVAGLGHEIGHAFMLSHPPPDSDDDRNALMGAGIYRGLDKCYLTAEDKRRLAINPFLVDYTSCTSVLAPSFEHQEGLFERREVSSDSGKTIVWMETKKSSSNGHRILFLFFEVGCSADEFLLHGCGRDRIAVRMRRGDGDAWKCFVSYNRGETYELLYVLREKGGE